MGNQFLAEINNVVISSTHEGKNIVTKYQIPTG